MALGLTAAGNPFARPFPTTMGPARGVGQRYQRLQDAVQVSNRKVQAPDDPLDVPGSLTAALNTGNGFGPASDSPSNYYDPYVCCEHVPIMRASTAACGWPTSTATAPPTC